MTVLPDLQRELVRAAGRTAEAPAQARSPQAGEVFPRRQVAPQRAVRRRVAVLAVVVIAAAGALAAIPGLGGGGGESAAQVLDRFAAQAASGLNTPVLAAGEAWYSTAVREVAAA